MKHHLPNSFQHEDIRTTDFSIWRGRIDLLTGGFPCQDISVVGAGKGITGKKSGLWVEAYRAIDEIKPVVVVLENSAELLKKGFENILYPLSEIGYNVEWECFKAIDFGFPHIRERLYILAYSDGIRWQSDYEKCGILPTVFDRSVLPNKAPDLLLSLGRPDRTRDFVDLQLDNGFPRELDKSGIKAFGNAVLPQIPYKIFKAIEAYRESP
jgi:DNA (cytosine-5)-methyltransferase 1